MTDEILSLRVLVASVSPLDGDLFRQAASASKVPVEIVDAGDAISARHSIAAGVDLAFLDLALGSKVIGQVTAAARAASRPPFTVLMSTPGTAAAFQTDALATKPSLPEEAMRLLQGSIRVCMPCRVMVVDDSSTMRSIIRKILAATRFPLEVTEVEQGGEAIELSRQGEFDIVFLDYNMPGFNGLETIGEFRRYAKREVTFVLISSMHDEAIITRARALGVAFLKKPFFPADIEAVLCRFYGLRALNPKRA